MSHFEPNHFNVRIDFRAGWVLFADLSTMIGGHCATLALAQCFDFLKRDPHHVIRKADVVAASAYINPNNIEGVDIQLELLALELLKTMIDGGFFAETDNELTWEYGGISIGKLTIRPRRLTATGLKFVIESHKVS